MTKQIKGLTLKEAMKPAQRAAMGTLPTTHKNCIAKTGVARPGKTARDRAKAQIRTSSCISEE